MVDEELQGNGFISIEVDLPAPNTLCDVIVVGLSEEYDWDMMRAVYDPRKKPAWVTVNLGDGLCDRVEGVCYWRPGDWQGGAGRREPETQEALASGPFVMHHECPTTRKAEDNLIIIKGQHGHWGMGLRLRSEEHGEGRVMIWGIVCCPFCGMVLPR